MTKTISKAKKIPPKKTQGKTAPSAPVKESHFFDKSFFIGLTVLVGLSVSFATFSRVIDPNNNQPAIGEESLSLFQHLSELVANRDQPLLGESSDRINILLLGIGGEGHDGAYLADTIILVSIKPSTGQLAMLSIPRDLYVPIPGYNYRKINNANAFGLIDDYPGGGESLTAEVVSEILDMPISYYARIDFSGFEKTVDDLGGITIDVEKSFVDSLYPTENYGYQTIGFQAGVQEMDGDQALKYVRSRKSTSDFDRSKRQQQVLLGIREKAMSFGTLLNPVKISDVLDDLGAHTRTNLELWEILRLASLIEDFNTKTINNVVLDSGIESPFMADSTPDGAYILRPKAGWDDWSEVQEIANNIFKVNQSKTETASIIVQNGTNRVGLASQTSQLLEHLGFEVIRYENASARDHQTTLIYDFTNGTRPEMLNILKRAYPDAQIPATVPLYLAPDSLPSSDFTVQSLGLDVDSISGSMPDFLLILGNESQLSLLQNQISSG
ncbi:MAG: LCP family protein [bacterium]